MTALRLTGVGLWYGLLAMGLGVVFGVLREIVLIPLLGPRAGALLEFGIVTLAIVWVGVRLVWSCPPLRWPARLALGAIGMAIVIVLESGLAIGVMGMSRAEYLASYDITRGGLFGVGLLAMALTPLLAGRPRE
jgi:hypothetical protein